ALHLNSQEEDGFLKALLRTRPDLAGLPFAMGGVCRTTGECAKAFKVAAEAVRSQKGAALLTDVPAPDTGEKKRQLFDRAHLAVVTQVLPAQDRADQASLVRSLSSVPTREATAALARLAVFSTDETVRDAAVQALAVRRETGSKGALEAGLHYP